MSIYHFVYKTTNTINSKYYYGVHTTSDIDDGYLGSGVLLRRSIKKYGKEAFKREIISFFDNQDSAYLYESNLVSESIVNDDMSYNLCVGGQGAVGKMIPTKTTKLKMSEAMRERHALYGHPNTGKKFGKRDKEIYVRVQATKKINGFKTRKGQKNSEEQKNNQRLAALSRPKHECPHCQREFTIQTMTRYHGNKCVMRL